MGKGPLTAQADSETDIPTNQKSTGNAAHILSVGLPPGALIAQTKDSVADADGNGIIEFKFDPPIRGFTLEMRPSIGATPDPDEAVLFTVSADNPAMANVFLDETNDAQRESVRLDDGIQTRTFDGDTISLLYIKPVGTTPLLTITVGGV